MKYDVDFLISFLNTIEQFSLACEKEITKASEAILEKNNETKKLVLSEKNKMNSIINSYITQRTKSTLDYQINIDKIEENEIKIRNQINDKIIKCKERLYGDISSTEKNDLEIEIVQLEEKLFQNHSIIEEKRYSMWNKHLDTVNEIENQLRQAKNAHIVNLNKIIDESKKQCMLYETTINEELEHNLNKIKNTLYQTFPPKQLKDMFFNIFENEPEINEFKCKKENPKFVHVGDLLFPFTKLKLCDYAIDTINESYFFLTKYSKNISREEFIKVPYCINFDKNFNYTFELNNWNREIVIDYIYSLASRLIMMIPPNKINFTFFDPITMGETFAIFTGLVDFEDKISKVINDKIWTTHKDIEDKLRITTNHIANVTQRCLQGQYSSIQEYNIVANQNAEPYQVLMILDFPAGFNENSLKLLEQIISTGPKCGVYTVLAKNEEQYIKIEDPKRITLVDNIVNSTNGFIIDGSNINVKNKVYNNTPVLIQIR